MSSPQPFVNVLRMCNRAMDNSSWPLNPTTLYVTARWTGNIDGWKTTAVSWFSGHQHRSVADSSADNIRRRILPPTGSVSAANSTAPDFHSCDCQQYCLRKTSITCVENLRFNTKGRLIQTGCSAHRRNSASSRDTHTISHRTTVNFPQHTETLGDCSTPDISGWQSGRLRGSVNDAEAWLDAVRTHMRHRCQAAAVRLRRGRRASWLRPSW